MKSVELFAGAGGLALGVHLAGFEHQALVEFDKNACATLRTNAEKKSVPGIGSWNIIEGDVRDKSKVSFSRYQGADLLSGGVPCQPFSCGGKRRGRDDERDMFPEFIQAVREIQPRAFLIENVKGLMWKEDYFKYVLLQLQFPTLPKQKGEKWTQHCSRLQEEAGADRDHDLQYTVDAKLLNAADYGVPQRRERVFIVGFQKKLKVQWSFPPPTHSRAALLHSQQTGEYWKRHELPCPSVKNCADAGPAKPINRDIFHDLAPWVTVRDALRQAPPLPDPKPRDNQGYSGHELVEGARSYPGHTGSNLDLPAKTLKAGVHGVPGGENTLVLPNGKVRYFTIREAARLQTFPDEWIFEGAWAAHIRQLGNAVPVKLVYVVASEVAAQLRAVDRRGNGARAA
jgi:DNA (cytosine-5)-methyltransferase 1